MTSPELVSRPNIIRRPVIEEGVRCGAGVYASNLLWAHRSHDQWLEVDPALLSGKPIGSCVVAVLGPGLLTVTAIEDAAGVATVTTINNRTLEIGAIRWDTYEVF